MKMSESSQKGWKTLREKLKLLVTANFFFSHSAFKRLVLQTRENQGLFGKRLNRIRYYHELHGLKTRLLELREFPKCERLWCLYQWVLML